MSQAATKVLVVEDEIDVRTRIETILKFEGYDTVGAGSVREGLRLSLSERPDIVVSDILMENGDGLELVSVLRSRPESRLLPIIMVTALSDRQWQRRFMALGADDYITKPFTTEELVSAVHSQRLKIEWRKTENLRAATRNYGCLFNGIEFDPIQRLLTFSDGRRDTLTVSEANLLIALLDHANESVSRESISETMGRQYSPLERTIDVLIVRLRKKIGDPSLKPDLIVTLRSVGYMLHGKVERIDRMAGFRSCRSWFATAFRVLPSCTVTLCPAASPVSQQAVTPAGSQQAIHVW
ncbi:MAG: response regulator transcription factor [Alphaproteobacteria bacterium]|jgi:two-component system, OmpR family, response regulator|nr:response regulator transcription factor [Rhodospirillaceae bacterium]MBT6205711.1 response regulator transcription factor [Rhodospirillaceae bacterium]MBT6509507.1 response regulator transcription factor [Rhodospirillaceae bacterium]MBT7615339.1 response regulator transcription factor [Rhodospirillaceae bacterium]MDG2479719.1 response regulator transcription factor [Alphaproteobacteria bacterium]